jgi:hypothetical protein
VDYRALNTIIIKNHYFLPLIQKILVCFSRTKFYTKLNIIIVFNRIRIAEKQEYLIVFNTCYSLFETLVILFGLSNTLVTFQTRINEILYLYLDVFYIVYINNILVYSNNLLEYKEYIKKILYVLQDTSFQLDIKKYKFEVIEIIYLGLILFIESVRIDPAKIKYIIN